MSLYDDLNILIENLKARTPVDRSVGSPFGVRIQTNPALVEHVQYSRSPSRAKRRAARGYLQHYAMRPKKDAFRLPDGTLVMHPQTYEALKAIVQTTQGKGIT